MIIRCFKGTGRGDARDFDLDPNATLHHARQTLTSAGFMPADQRGIAYRFVSQSAETSNLIESLITINAEQVVPLQAAWGKNKQLIITNQNATHRPDLIGIGVKEWTNRHLTARCQLNNEASSRQNNERIQAFQLLMLDNVVASNPALRAKYEHICVCTDGSTVEFVITSWGAAGYEYYIGSDIGEPIASSVYMVCGNQPNRYLTGSLRRWQHAPKMIEIVGTSQMNLGSRRQAYQKVTIKSRRVWEYKQNGVVYSSNARPPGGALLASSTVPGGGIEAGGATEGAQSDASFGGMDYAKADDWSQTLGEITVHFFVFKSHADALATIAGYNAPAGMEDAFRPPPDTTPLSAVGLLYGTYQRHPVENDWHIGTIGPGSGGNLRWTNKAGASWALIPDLARNVLRKEAGSTYQNYENGREFIVIARQGEVDGFNFLGEFYQRD